MKYKIRLAVRILLVFCFVPLARVSVFSKAEAQSYEALSPQTLANLVGPIALYPDPLLAQLLPACTYPQQVAQAAQWLQQNTDLSGLNSQMWDPSVVAIAHYPSVIQMMVSNQAWTAQLGSAYVNQQKDVIQTIQNERALAQNAGNLQSNSQQQVVVQNNYIQILPASSDVLYVPDYDSTVVYTQSAATTPLVAFGAGLAMGSWMTSDVDWNNQAVVYHGWDGGWGHYYYGANGPGYGTTSAWRAGGTTANGGAWVAGGSTGRTVYGGSYAERSASGTGAYGNSFDTNAVAGRTANGGAYAARDGSAEFANGTKANGTESFYAGPNGVSSSRGWSASNGDDSAGSFSKTVATQNGIYNVHGAGASDGSDSMGGLTVSGVNKDGDYGSKTWTDNNGSFNSRGDSGSAFSGAQSGGWASNFSDRGYTSRSSSSDSFEGGGGGFRGGGFRR